MFEFQFQSRSADPEIGPMHSIRRLQSAYIPLLGKAKFCNVGPCRSKPHASFWSSLAAGMFGQLQGTGWALFGFRVHCIHTYHIYIYTHLYLVPPPPVPTPLCLNLSLREAWVRGIPLSPSLSPTSQVQDGVGLWDWGECLQIVTIFFHVFGGFPPK